MSYLLAAFSWTALGLSALILNLIQMGSLILWPFSPKLFRRVNVFVAWMFWRLCVFFVEKVYRVEIVFSGDEPPAGENVVLFCNHQQMPDILVLMPLAHKCRRLGDMKWFVKDVLKYVPGIGWGMLFLDCIFLKRNWAADAGRVSRTFHGLIHHGMPFWVISFSEGTRITPAKLAKSQDFAKASGLRVPQFVMIPKTKGFTASVNELRSRLNAIYDITIGYEPGVPSLRDFFKGRLTKAHLHVRRFPISELPIEEKALSAWLIQRFEEKDQLMGRFHQTRRFT